MLVAISDLHLLDETAGRHNPSPGAFTHVFLPHIAALARSKKVHEVKLLLLGDVVDFIRTEHWFNEPMVDRPWGNNGLADIEHPRDVSATERRALRMLGELPERGGKDTVPHDTILYRNWEALLFLREFGDHLREELGRPDLPVEVIYVPGNHDRLCNVYPRLRDQMQKILGATVAPGTVQGDPDGEWWFRNDYIDETHGVFARHGQQFDFWNYGGGNDYTRTGHIAMPIGDLLGVEFGGKLPHRLAAMKGEYEGITDTLIDAMKDMGLVRPFTHALEWLYFRIEQADKGPVREALQRAFKEVFTELLEIDFVQQWRSPHTRIDNALRALSSRWLSWIPRTIINRLDAENLLPFFRGVGSHPLDPDLDKHLQAAYNENIWRDNEHIQYILYGHTHFPMQRPLEGGKKREIIYVNTGSFRESIFKTIGLDTEHDFMKFKQITYSIFYRGDEDMQGKAPGTLSYEAWTGQKKKMYGG